LHIWLWFHSAARQIGASFRPLPVPADAQSRFETGLREDARHDRDPSSRHLGIDYAGGFVVQTRDSVKMTSSSIVDLISRVFESVLVAV